METCGALKVKIHLFIINVLFHVHFSFFERFQLCCDCSLRLCNYLCIFTVEYYHCDENNQSISGFCRQEFNDPSFEQHLSEQRQNTYLNICVNLSSGLISLFKEFIICRSLWMKQVSCFCKCFQKNNFSVMAKVL